MARAKVATPVNWKRGEEVIIGPALRDAERLRLIPQRRDGASALHACRAAARRLILITLITRHVWNRVADQPAHGLDACLLHVTSLRQSVVDLDRDGDGILRHASGERRQSSVANHCLRCGI